MGRAEIFVYYRVDAADEQDVRSWVRQFQAGLAARLPGLEARLLAKVEQPVRDLAADHGGEAAADFRGHRTLMETYRRAGGVDAECRAAIDSAAAVIAPWLRSPRQVEMFTPCG